MRKFERVISSINTKGSAFRFEELRSVPIKVISARDGYSFLDDIKDLLLPITSFDTVNRENFLKCEHSAKNVSDMIISGNRMCNLVGYSNYYEYEGDIYCEKGCVYSKRGSIFCLSMVDKNLNNMLIVSKYYKRNEFAKCVIKSFIDCERCEYDELIIGNINDYIIIR